MVTSIRNWNFLYWMLAVLILKRSGILGKESLKTLVLLFVYKKLNGSFLICLTFGSSVIDYIINFPLVPRMVLLVVLLLFGKVINLMVTLWRLTSGLSLCISP